MKTKYITNLVMAGIVLSPVIAVTEANASTDERAVEIVAIKESNTDLTPIKPLFLERGKPKALDSYWHKMAQCETGGDWQDHGQWSGGLGIYTRTWINFGGLEFAKKPEFATIEQQIIVANRISTQGYQTKNTFRTHEDRINNRPLFRNPVGFGGWGCLKHVGKPLLFKKPPYKIFFKKYKIGQRSEQIRRLQHIIGMHTVDGYYGPKTRKAHLEYVKKNRAKIIEEYNKYR